METRAAVGPWPGRWTTEPEGLVRPRLPLPALLIPMLLAVPGAAAGQEEGGKGAILVTGRVTERDPGGAIPGARIVLEGTDLVDTSDAQGLFAFLRVPPGSYVLRVERLGFGTVRDSVAIPERGRLDLAVQMVREPVELEPLVVAVEYGGGPRLREFYQRRRTGLGDYITRADFEDRHLVNVTDAFRQIAGVRLVPRTAGGVTLGNAVLLRGGCRPSVFLDGVRLADRGAAIDELLHPNDIEGIEVYKGPYAPAQYAGEGCGTILVWTRPGGGEGRLPWWKGALIGGAILTLGVLFGH